MEVIGHRQYADYPPHRYALFGEQSAARIDAGIARHRRRTG